MASALLVDGAGRTRPLEVEDGLQFIKVVPDNAKIRASGMLEVSDRIAEYSATPIATFEYVGRLPDERVVYGLMEARLQMWEMVIATYGPGVVTLTATDQQKRIDAWIQRCGEPVVILYDQTTERVATKTKTRRIQGVARRM